MNSATISPNAPTGLKLGLTPKSEGQSAPRITAPAPAVQGAGATPADKHQKKDGFLAAAALGGIVASLAMVLLLPTGYYVTKLVKQSFGKTSNPASVVQPPRVVEWPSVELSGLLAANAKRGGSAILNGQLINLNQTILNVRVVAFQNQGVVLEYDGAQKSIQVGENTL